MPRYRLKFGSWALRIFSWDAFLPALIAILPKLVRLLLPNRRGIIECIAVILPIAAFFFRIAAGRRQIGSNHCGESLRRFQFCAFCVGIVPLIAIDCLLVLSDLMPPNALFESETDRMVWLVLISFYLIMMVIAMYPGRTPVVPDWSNDLFDFGQESRGADEFQSSHRG